MNDGNVTLFHLSLVIVSAVVTAVLLVGSIGWAYRDAKSRGKWRTPTTYGALVGLIVLPVAYLLGLLCQGGVGKDMPPGMVFFMPVVVGLFGVMFGGIVGTCFRGDLRSNRGAIVFAFFFGLGFASDQTIEMGAKLGFLQAVGWFPMGAIMFGAVGAIFGRLIVAIVKWTQKRIGGAIPRTGSPAVVGALAGAISSACLLGCFVLASPPPIKVFSMSVGNESVDALLGTVSGTLLGSVPLVIGVGIAGAIAGAITREPVPSQPELEAQTTDDQPG